MEVFWESAGPPNWQALPNLRKISKYMHSEGFTSPINTASASQISKGAGVSLNQVLNLINRPGFVYIPTGPQSLKRWYYLWGYEYPEKLPIAPGQTKLLRGIVPDESASPVVSPVTLGEAKVVEQLLKPGQVIIEAKTLASHEANSLSFDELVKAFDPPLRAIIEKRRTAKDFAEYAYKIADGIQSGKLVVK